VEVSKDTLLIFVMTTEEGLGGVVDTSWALMVEPTVKTPGVEGHVTLNTGEGRRPCPTSMEAAPLAA
jgi:hypothetical protein